MSVSGRPRLGPATWVTRAALVLGALANPGCQAAPPAAGPPRTEPGASPPNPQQQQYGEHPSGGGTQPAPTQPGYAQPPPDPGAHPERILEESSLTLEGALQLLDQRGLELSATGVDCSTACRALASMRRARDRICELSGGEDRDGRCATATTRHQQARERVRQRCEGCADDLP